MFDSYKSVTRFFFWGGEGTIAFSNKRGVNLISQVIVLIFAKLVLGHEFQDRLTSAKTE
jgi:hypothetical protein